MSSLITLLFAPSFLILIHYFDFKKIVSFYILLSLSFLLYAFFKKKKLEDFILLGIYLLFLGFAYFFVSMEAIKFISIFTAMAFFSLFAEAAIHKKELILKLTQKFYKKELTKGEIIFLKKSDLYWASSIFLYMLIQVIVVFYASDVLWAFFSSAGWYIYFVFILLIQILYGKTYAIKMYS